MMEKVLFLDIDGVLNSARTAYAFGGYPHLPSQVDRFDLVAVALIRKVCTEVGARICLSSTWRLGRDWKELRGHLGLPITHRTPRLDGARRGEEIKAWMDAYNRTIEKWAIVDDDADMLPEQLHHFVQTCPRNGFTFENYERLKDLLS